MTLSKRTARLLALAIIIGNADCYRANLHAITGAPASDGSANGDRGQGADRTSNDTGAQMEVSDSGTPVTCPLPALKTGNTTQTIEVDGLTRTYVLHVPEAYDGSKPVPLILDFHALISSGSAELAASPYPAQTDPEGVIMAFPNGQKGPAGPAWNVGACCVSGVDDVAFANAVVDQIRSTACIDPKHVYAVGTSMGGGMAYYLACHAADVFAAVAPAAFDLSEDNAADCVPSRAVTVISFRGTADTVVPYAGGASSVVPGMPVTFLGAEPTFQKWAELDGCTGTPSGPDSNGCSTYASCKDNAEVILCRKQGGRQEAGNASIAWPVLRRHAL